MEEVVQTLAEEGVLAGERGHYCLQAMPAELHISPDVQGVLAARIDRLTAAEKELLQQASVIGRQFPVRLLKHVVAQPPALLVSGSHRTRLRKPVPCSPLFTIGLPKALTPKTSKTPKRC